MADAGMKVSWEKKFEIEAALIEEVRIRPNLWHNKHSLHKSRSYQKVSHTEIVEALKVQFPEFASGFTVDRIKHKIRNLHYYYNREKQRMENIKRKFPNYTPKWVHFKRLQFLDKAKEADENIDENPENVNLLSQSVTSEATDSEEDSNNSQVDSGTENINEMDENVNILSQSVTSETTDSEEDLSSSQMDSDRENDESSDNLYPPQKKKKYSPDNTKIADKSSLMQSLNSVINDADVAFANVVINKLNKITDTELKEKAKVEVQNILDIF